MVEDETDNRDPFMAGLLIEDGLARLISLGFLEARGYENVVMHRLVAALSQLELQEDDVQGQTAVAQVVQQVIEKAWYEAGYLGFLPITPIHVHTVTDESLRRQNIYAGRLAGLWGRHLLDMGSFKQAETYLKQALVLEEKLPNREENVGEYLQNLGTIKWSTDALDEAWPYYERALAIHQKKIGDMHIKTANSFNNLAILHSRSGSYDVAQTYFEQALTIYEQLPERDGIAISRTNYNLGIMTAA